jgi:hypothetical protein
MKTGVAAGPDRGCGTVGGFDCRRTAHIDCRQVRARLRFCLLKPAPAPDPMLAEETNHDRCRTRPTRDQHHPHTVD